jgi:hypothetical protein
MLRGISLGRLGALAVVGLLTTLALARPAAAEPRPRLGPAARPATEGESLTEALRLLWSRVWDSAAPSEPAAKTLGDPAGGGTLPGGNNGSGMSPDPDGIPS